MRKFLCLLPVATLAACGGAGPQSVGSQAAPAAPANGNTPAPSSNHSFVAPTVQKTYSGIGGVQSFAYSTRTPDATAPGQPPNFSTQSGQLYAADASTARNSGITVDYNPRDGIFDVKIAAPLANVSQTLRFQDPLHRTDFGGAAEPQTGTPQLTRNTGIQYLESGGSKQPIRFDPAQSTMLPVGDSPGEYSAQTFFYQKPGTETKYVTFAGYLRNQTQVRDEVTAQGPRTLQNNVLERAAFAFGERTDIAAVPKTGSATFNGAMVATMVFNPLRDTNGSAPTYFQWVEGRSQTVVDFAASTFTLSLNGTVFAPQFDAFTTREVALNAGATFTAAGSGRIDLINAGGFLGQFSTVSFTQGSNAFPLTLAGSSIDGAFFGPAAEEVGGGFRIVGGTPDERIDILGAFTGAK